jgi:hypothetical protein
MENIFNLYLTRRIYPMAKNCGSNESMIRSMTIVTKIIVVNKLVTKSQQ